ncbi:MAG: hypothetical protein WC989_03290 [Micavibrio sp.]
MADIINFIEARARLRCKKYIHPRPEKIDFPPEDEHAFIVVEIPKDVAGRLCNTDNPDWIAVLDYIIYGNRH